MKAVDGGVQWDCQYSDIGNLRMLFKDWEDINKVVQSIWEEKFEFKTYTDGLENRMLKVICLEEL